MILSNKFAHYNNPGGFNASWDFYIVYKNPSSLSLYTQYINDKQNGFCVVS